MSGVKATRLTHASFNVRSPEDSAILSRKKTTWGTFKTLVRMFAIFGYLGERQARHSGVGQCPASRMLLALFGPVAVRV